MFNSNDISNFQRFYYDLSEKSPLELLHITHKDPQYTLYDMHYELEFGIVVDGKMERHYGNWHINLEPGDIWLCGMWEPHWTRLSQTPCEVVVGLIYPEFLLKSSQEDFNWLSPFNVLPENRPKTEANNRQDILRIAKKITDIITLGEPEKTLWGKTLLFELLLTIQNDNLVVYPNHQNFKISSFSQIQLALQMVFENRRFISVEEAAAVCKMSRNGFAEKFKMLMGISFANFALRFRLSGVASQLLNTDDCIETIARDWGFTDLSHVHRHFIHFYGLTPGEYRQKSQQIGAGL